MGNQPKIKAKRASDLPPTPTHGTNGKLESTIRCVVEPRGAPPPATDDDPLLDFGPDTKIRRSVLLQAAEEYSRARGLNIFGAVAIPNHQEPPVGPPPQSRRERIMEICRELLIELGEDPDREGLAETPRRWADWWLEFTQYQPGNTETTFEAVSLDQVVVVGPMRVWSLCEHHLLPFWCDIWVAYIAEKKVLGLSKFARIAHQAAHRLQLQERLTHQIADEVQRITESHDVVVVGRGEHLCMSMRGIRTPALMTSSVIRGRFRELDALRAETLAFMTGRTP